MLAGLGTGTAFSALGARGAQPLLPQRCGAGSALGATARCAPCSGSPDLLVHTWDLARATGQDEALDAREVRAFLEGAEQLDPSVDAAMRASGHVGPRTPSGADASEQDRLLAFTGRRP